MSVEQKGKLSNKKESLLSSKLSSANPKEPPFVSNSNIPTDSLFDQKSHQRFNSVYHPKAQSKFEVLPTNNTSLFNGKKRQITKQRKDEHDNFEKRIDYETFEDPDTEQFPMKRGDRSQHFKNVIFTSVIAPNNIETINERLIDQRQQLDKTSPKFAIVNKTTIEFQDENGGRKGDNVILYQKQGNGVEGVDGRYQNEIKKKNDQLPGNIYKMEKKRERINMSILERQSKDFSNVPKNTSLKNGSNRDEFIRNEAYKIDLPDRTYENKINTIKRDPKIVKKFEINGLAGFGSFSETVGKDYAKYNSYDSKKIRDNELEEEEESGNKKGVETKFKHETKIDNKLIEKYSSINTHFKYLKNPMFSIDKKSPKDKQSLRLNDTDYDYTAYQKVRMLVSKEERNGKKLGLIETSHQDQSLQLSNKLKGYKSPKTTTEIKPIPYKFEPSVNNCESLIKTEVSEPDKTKDQYKNHKVL